MQCRIFVIAAAFALMTAASAQAGFWGDLKQGLGTAADNAKRDGAKAADAVGDAAGDAADAVVEGAEDAADYVTGDGDSAPTGAVDTSPEPVARGATPQPSQ